jgi:hypothetical protein
MFPATTSPRLDDMQQQLATIEHAIHSVPVSQVRFTPNTPIGDFVIAL